MAATDRETPPGVIATPIGYGKALIVIGRERPTHLGPQHKQMRSTLGIEDLVMLAMDALCKPRNLPLGSIWEAISTTRAKCIGILKPAKTKMQKLRADGGEFISFRLKTFYQERGTLPVNCQ